MRDIPVRGKTPLGSETTLRRHSGRWLCSRFSTSSSRSSEEEVWEVEGEVEVEGEGEEEVVVHGGGDRACSSS